MALRSLLVLGVLVGIGRPAVAQQVPAVARPVAASAAAPAPQAAADKSSAEPPSSWSDPRVIAELVKNCRFDALRDRIEWLGDVGAGSTHPLTCLSGRDQSCVPDPCFTDTDDKGCRGRCEQTCNRCSDSCGNQCASCKTRCRDDACRLGCAQQCATCQQSCVRAVDRCSSGKCSAEYEQCRARLKASWLRYHCDRVYSDAKNACEKKCTTKKPGEPEMDEICVEDCVRARSSAHCDLSDAVRLSL